MNRGSQATEGELLSRARHGDVQAQFELGGLLLGGERRLEGLDWMLKAGRGGHSAAAVQAARLLMLVAESPDSLGEAVELLTAAEKAGEADAPYLLALLALGDLVVERDFKVINARVQESARRGCVPAWRAMALGYGRIPDAGAQRQALGNLTRAMGHGDWVAASLLAERTRLGDCMAPDPKRARAIDAQLQASGVPPLPRIPPVIEGWPEQNSKPALALESLLELPEAETRCESPYIRVIDNLLTPEECRFLIAISQPYQRRSMAHDPVTGEAATYQVRTSSDASIDIMAEDFALRLVQLRLALAAGCELVNGENLVVLWYRPGEEYKPHCDYLPSGALDKLRPQAGQRSTTICVYLNPVEAGGETDFPELDVRVSPAPGRAVIFDNIDADGKPHASSRHAGLPVKHGEKWLATLWLRQRPFRFY